MDEFIYKIFSETQIVKTVNGLAPATSPIMDEFYKNRVMHPFAHIEVAEIIETIKAVPLVKRGGKSVSVGNGEGEVKIIEPQPLNFDTFIKATDLNNLKLFSLSGNNGSIDSYRNNKIEFLRNTARVSTEAICAQSLTGSIAYPIVVGNAMELYEVSFGTTQSYSISKKWEADTTTLGDILKDILAMATLVKKSGLGSQVGFKIGQDVFLALVNKITSMTNDNRIEAKVNEGNIMIAGYKLELLNTQYWHAKDKAYKESLEAHKVMCYLKDAPWNFRYLAIDDIKIGLKAMPLMIRPIEENDGSGYTLLAKSTPFPIPPTKAICFAEATTV